MKDERSIAAYSGLFFIALGVAGDPNCSGASAECYYLVPSGIFFDWLQNEFREFAGLANRDDVTFVVDDARSFYVCGDCPDSTAQRIYWTSHLFAGYIAVYAYCKYGCGQFCKRSSSAYSKTMGLCFSSYNGDECCCP